MPKFGNRSINNLSGAHPEIQRLFNEVIKHIDCTVLCGHRGQAEQDAAFNAGNSKLRYPQSKHNKQPSLAADVMRWYADKPNVRWPDLKGLNPEELKKAREYASTAHFAGVVRGMALVLGIPIRWGGDWNRDFELQNGDDWDMPHYELDGQ
jgi:peptidoglycan L-alanyl-D-glutamate endopeptidase CwlK